MRSHAQNDGRFIVRLMFCLGAALAIVTPASSEPMESDSVDLRPVFDRWELSPRAQGGRGTCSVFTITGAIEYALAEKQHQEGPPTRGQEGPPTRGQEGPPTRGQEGPPTRGRGTRLSVEFLNWASNRVIGKRADGGFFSDLWKGFQSHGICDEDDMPYAATFDPSQQPSSAALEHARKIQEAGLRLHWIKKWNPHKGLTEEQFVAVKEMLRRWPVCGGFLWPKKAKWTDGVLEMAPRQGVRDGHSVLLVGFRDDPKQPGGGVFLVRDSSTGPRDGVSRSADQRSMSYEYVRAYMNDAVWVDYDGAESSR